MLRLLRSRLLLWYTQKLFPSRGTQPPSLLSVANSHREHPDGGQRRNPDGGLVGAAAAAS